jgi:flagellum-specific peptidoglycan hydrolase FlgJ
MAAIATADLWPRQRTETGYVLRMIRFLHLVLPAALALSSICFVVVPAIAQTSATIQMAAATDAQTSTKAKSTEQKSAKDKSSKDKSAEAKAAKSAAKKGGTKKTEAKNGAKNEEKSEGKPVQIANFGDWGAFLAEGGKEKTCYVLAQPKDRAPAALKRDPAYVFISSRPGENIHDEVSITMGFPMRHGGDAQADVAGTSFDLVSKGTNAWVKNPAQEADFIDAMKKGAKLVVKATSVKGHTTTDSYSLSGLSEALDRVEKECR